MNKNFILFIIILILAIAGLFYVLNSDNKNSLSIETPAINTSVTITPQASTSSKTNTPINVPVAQPTSHTVTYTETGFSPATLTIKNGDTVTFKNNSARTFWPASNDHPSHTIYPEFDPKQTIAAGSSWSFTFTKTGSWKYHDHRAANLGGVVIVQ